jgi:hypothetical protein
MTHRAQRQPTPLADATPTTRRRSGTGLTNPRNHPLLPRPGRCLPVVVAAVLVTLSSSHLIAWPVAAASADLTPVPRVGCWQRAAWALSC